MQGANTRSPFKQRIVRWCSVAADITRIHYVHTIGTYLCSNVVRTHIHMYIYIYIHIYHVYVHTNIRICKYAY